MIITKRIIIIGNSLGIVIDKQILIKMKIKKGDFVELNMKLVK